LADAVQFQPRWHVQNTNDEEVKIMKKNMMLLVSIALVLAALIGYTTYAWFTAQVKSTGSDITTGTLLLNGSTDSEKGALFTIDNCQPGDEPQEISPFVIKNTGTLDLNISTAVEVNYEKDGLDWSNESRKYFKIKPAVRLNGELVIDDENEQEMSFDEFKTWLEGLLTGKKLAASEDGNGGYYEISGEVYLDSEAGNECQAVTATVGIIVNAEQVNKGTTE
jgi:predicted ribosomally synthesized peptide with SipW-like signal peptide